jgi:NAD+ diphosphatase
MIQEINPHHFNNHYLANRDIQETDFILHYRENSLLLKISNGEFSIPQKKDFHEITGKTEHAFLFTLDDVPCFLIWENLSTDEPCFVYKEVGFFRVFSQQEIAWISIAGFHLMNWYAQNKFCGKCGAKTQQKSDERALLCPHCHHIIYPKIAPAVIVAIVCSNKILLARGINFRGDWYSLIAGYVDVCESFEEALIREVKEEVGLDITNIRYYKSQPWPLSGSVMIGFVAEADEAQPIRIDRSEIEEAAWFSRGNLPKYSLNISIAGEMIEKFEHGEL